MSYASTMVKHSAIALWVLACILPSAAFAHTYFSWNADSSVTSIATCGYFRAALDTGDKVQGSASMRLTIAGTDQTQVGCEVVPNDLGSSVGKTFYYRWWMKLDSQYSWGSADKKIKASRVGTATELFTIYLMHNRIELSPIDESLDYLSCLYDFNPKTNPAVAIWQEYVIELKQQSSLEAADGHMKLYVNGKLVAQDVNQRFYATAGNWSERWGAFMSRPLPQLNDLSGGGSIWVDDFSLDDAFNSTIKTRPEPPGSVIVN